MAGKADVKPDESGEAPVKRGRGRPKEPIRRARLLEIAAMLFATQGFTKTTVRDIADAAGMLSGSLYHHFPSKEAILDEILREYLGGLYEAYAEIEASSDDPKVIVDSLIRHTLTIIHENPYAVALYQDEAKVILGAPGYEWIIENSKNVEAVWVRAIEAGKKSGVFRKEIDAGVTYRFIRDTVWSVVRWYRPGGRLGAQKVSDQYLLLIHSGMLSE